jgi:hypothetical protein
MTLGGSARRSRVSLVLAFAVCAAASDACTPFDTAISPIDASADVTGPDAGDASPDADGGSGLPGDGGASDGGDATLTPPINIARLGTAKASSTSGSHPAGLLIDGDPSTSWYASLGSCPFDSTSSAYACAGDTTYAEVVLDAPRIVERVKIAGNRDYASGYDVLTGRILLLDANGASLYGADLTTTRGAEPNGNADHVVTPPVANVKIVRFVVRTAESSGPGISELEVLGH